MRKSNDPFKLVISKQLNGIDFPVTKKEMIEHLRVRGLPYEVLRYLSRIPKTYFLDKDDFEQALFQYKLESENISKSHPITFHFKYFAKKEY